MRAGQTVLIIDDEELVRNVACAILGNRGYNVLAAESAEAALRLTRDHSAGMSIAVLDANMPEVEPAQLVEALQTICPNLAVMICSGFLRQEALRRYDLSRISGFLQKPYTAARLRDAVESALASYSVAA